jgi:hypothetical protein
MADPARVYIYIYGRQSRRSAGYTMNDLDWHTSANAYLARLGAAEYAAQRSRHKGSPKKFRFSPSQYMTDLIECLNVNDEERFKAIKMLEGYSTPLKV